MYQHVSPVSHLSDTQLILGDLDKPFLMYVEDVFSISGRGTVCTGKVERGTITKGAEVELVGLGPPIKTTLTGIGEVGRRTCA